MINDFGGVQNAEKLPTTNTVNSFFKDDILFSNIRTYFKKVWYAKFDGTVSQDVLTFRAKDNIIPKYLYYTLFNPEFTEYTVLTSKGAKMPRGDKDAIKNLEIQLPPLPEQKAIASVLSSLDDKIDLLHQQNQTLEALAETLFRQWFIERCPEPVEGEAKEDGKNVKYMIESEVYMGDSGYEFEFNDVTGQLKEVRISWLP
jgi:type I restriction enzyme S subunit